MHPGYQRLKTSSIKATQIVHYLDNKLVWWILLIIIETKEYIITICSVNILFTTPEHNNNEPIIAA